MALRMTFQKLGTNEEGAIIGDLTLLDGNTTIKTSRVFSGGNGSSPIDDGTYRIRLDIRGDESTNQIRTDGTLEPFYGIQKVSDNIVDDDGVAWDAQVEWGTLRARLNPKGDMPDRGQYVHGKKRPRDWTQGCICERLEAILESLWELPSSTRHVDVVVSGGNQFHLGDELSSEEPDVKNVAKKLD